MAPSTSAVDKRAQAWSYLVILLAVLVAYGAVWTRGIQGDDLCMCELAATNDYWDAVRQWLNNWNGRLFLALTQIGTYHLPWFHDPLEAPWYLIHGMAVLGHFSVCGLLFQLLVRAGIKPGASLAATLVFSIHPITFEPVLWLAESYGYVFGNLLTVLAVWAYLEYERRSNIGWLALTFLTALFAILGIEQHLFVLGALAVVYLLSSLWRRPVHPPWLPLLVVSCCALVFLALHFVVFSGTTERLARATNEVHQVSGAGIAWKLAWWLNVFPGASPYGGFFQVGLRTLTEHGWLVALVALAALGAAWRMAAASSWLVVAASPLTNRHLWLILTGAVVFSAALLPFLFTGKYEFAIRNMYVALPGLLIAGAAVLDLLSGILIWRTVLRFTLAPVVATYLAMSLTIDIGAQAAFAQSWQLHQNVIHAIETDAEAIRQSKAVEVTGIPPVPYEGTSMLGTAWAFPCLVRWILGDEVKGWNNLMPFDKRPSGLQNSHRVHLRTPE